MSSIHAVIGTGTAKSAAIAEALRDATSEGDSFNLIWTGKPTAGQEAVFDFVLDNEYQFVMFYEDGDNPPKVFRESDHGLVQKSRDPYAQMVDDVDTVLFLWDDDENPDLIGEVWDAVHPEGVPILELTNGLTPIVLEEEEEEVTEARESRYSEDDDDDDEEEDDTRFTKDELEVMAASAVKRYGERIGAKGTTKKAIIAELFPEDEESEEEFNPMDVEPDDPAVTDPDEGVKLGQVLPKGMVDLHDDVEQIVSAVRDFLYKVARGEYN